MSSVPMMRTTVAVSAVGALLAAVHDATAVSGDLALVHVWFTARNASRMALTLRWAFPLSKPVHPLEALCLVPPCDDCIQDCEFWYANPWPRFVCRNSTPSSWPTDLAWSDLATLAANNNQYVPQPERQPAKVSLLRVPA
jgi:hypothetical protein